MCYRSTTRILKSHTQKKTLLSVIHEVCSLLLLLFSGWVVSDSLQPHELQLARLLCPSPSPGVGANPCPLSQWCHPIISSPVIPFSRCPQTFPASNATLNLREMKKCVWCWNVSAITSREASWNKLLQYLLVNVRELRSYILSEQNLCIMLTRWQEPSTHSAIWSL